MKYVVEKEFDADNNIIKLSGVLVSIHCHHYNCGLLKAMEEITLFDGRELFMKIAEEQFYYNYKDYLAKHPELKAESDKLGAASELYSLLGFGKIDLSRLTSQGGTALSVSSYYVIGWLAKYGRRKTPICHFARGFLAGILEVVYNKPLGSYEVNEITCIVTGDDECKFEVKEK